MTKRNKIVILVLLAVFLVFSNVFAQETEKEAIEKADHCFDNGDYDGVIAASSKAIELNPANVDNYLRRGTAYLDKAGWDQAISDFNKAIELDPNCYIYYKALGLVYDHKLEWSKAISEYNKAIELNPNEPGTYQERAREYYNLADYDKAWDDVHKAESLGCKVDFIDQLKKISGRVK